jgi:DnaJ-class molecular chaperone
MNPSETSDMYERLGIDEYASYEEIKEAYRKAALYWHPDRNTDKEKAHLEFIAVSEAFEKLSKRFNRKKKSKKKKSYSEEYEYYDEMFKEI